MHYSTNRKRNRNNKHSIKSDNIDKQILQLHIAMAEKIVKNPQLILPVIDKLEERYANNKMHYGAYLTWHSLLELIDTPTEFVAQMSEDSNSMRKLRRKSPMVGILTESERVTVLEKLSCGGTSIDSLF